MRLFLILLILLLPAPLAAQTQNWQAAMASSSPRLRLFSLMISRPDGAADAVGALQRAQGFAHPPGAAPQLIQQGLTFAPILGFDNNINGGTPGTTILIAGLPFTLSPESRAKKGVIGGLNMGANLRFSLSPTTVLDASLSATRARALDYDLDIATQNASLCLGHYMGGANWLDICTGISRSDRALSQSDDRFSSLALLRQFATKFAIYEARGKLRQTSTPVYDKLSLEMGLSAAHGPWGLLEGGVEFGQYIPGQHTRLFGANLALTRPVLGKDTTFFASYGREGGADFFGLARRDEVVAYGVTRPLIGRLGVTLSMRDRTSSLANYDGVSYGLDFTFRGFSF